MAYCRPIEFCRIAADLEALPSRRIEISIDGPTFGTETDNQSVIKCAESWKSWSKHEIKIWLSEKNLGLFDHFSIALGRFFSEHKWGLVLEDDLEIRCEFIDFLDSSYAKNLLNQFFSICGHNPLTDLSDYGTSQTVHFQETNIHTISGWASSASSVHFFLELLKNSRSDVNLLESIIQDFSHRITKDPLLARSLYRNWSGKIMRAAKTPKPNWDNYWELAAWSSGKPSIRPTFSLTRESPITFGKQTHDHHSKLDLWPPLSQKLILDFNKVLPVNKKMEIKALRIWGTNRIRAYKEFVNQALGR
jgi:hypothetical protein